jgi:[protein-PII] uridylyltransferase
VDVLLLLPDDLSPDDDERLKGQIEAFIGSCWDAGLEIGSSVRTLSDCVAEAAKDVTVQTSLLESRLVTATAAVCAFRRRFNAAMDPAAFFVAKTLELRQRHTKFEDTPYALEPNCKESPGGLRDLQVILWVARAAGLGKSWDELARKRPRYALRGAPDQAQRGPAEPDPRPAAPDCPPPRGPAGI